MARNSARAGALLYRHIGFSADRLIATIGPGLAELNNDVDPVRLGSALGDGMARAQSARERRR